ncbi:S8 family serine peptidase [Paenibacillus sp. DR312]|uniref:S8 family serine peptidase n=1 Tax=unclassified Paenibacillus TaxID=185978 RepID=UPI001C9526D3|nr:S8 family serine peptidase [Paenibacillus sp. DR312]QZN76204.1 S8 family serine peptidase [Paenibacillus sp. DR312]
MGKHKGIIATTLAISLLLNAGIAHAGSQNGSVQEVIIVYKNADGKEAIIEESVDVKHEFETIPAVAATVTSADLRELTSDPNIAYIERNTTLRITGGDIKVTAVPAEQSQWNFQAIQPTKRWDEGYTGAGVKVAVIDTGIFAHDELTIAGGVSTVDYTTSYNDDRGHGTHVAGIIAAKSGNGGIVGIAPDVELYAVKAIGADGEGTILDVLEGVEWSIQNGMDIINISLGMDIDSIPFKEMIDNAYDAGIVIVGTAGNEQEGIPLDTYTIQYPAKYDSVIAVGAVDSLNQRGIFSSVGEEVELAAPGVDIISTYVKADGTGGYGKSSGTSQAAPHVSGMIALLMQKYPTMSNVELREEIKKYAVDLGAPGRDIEYGFGSLSFNKDVTPPANVTNLAIADKSENSISLTWKNPQDVDFATNNIFANNVKVGTTNGEVFTLENLQSNTSYTIAVKSVDQNGNESAGEVVVAKTDADVTAPAEVSNLAVAEKTTTSAKITWTNPTDSDFLRVNLTQNGTSVGNTTATEHEFKELTPNTTYVFDFKTEDMEGNVSTGQSVTVTTDDVPVVDTTAPAEVSGLNIGEVTTTSAEITWINPSDVDFEKVNVYKDNVFVGDVSGTRYVFNGLNPSTNYELKAKTVDANGNESVGETVTVTTKDTQPVVDTTPPAEVSNLTLGEVTTTTAAVSWVNPSDPDFVKSNLYLNGTPAGETPGTSYVFNGLTADTNYVLQVKTVDANGNESSGRYVMTKTMPAPDTTPPTEVGNLVVSLATEDTLTFSWENPSDPDFDHVQVFFDGQLVPNVTGNVYQATGLYPNLPYTLLVKTVDQKGNISTGRSIIGTTSTVVQPPVDNTPPGEVLNLEVANATVNTIRVRWINPMDVDYAKANVYLNGTFVADTTNSFYEFAGLTEDNAFTIVIKTVDVSGNESMGTSTVGRTQATPVVTPPVDPQPPVDTTAPAEVTGLVTDATSHKTITARWINPSDSDFAKVKLFVNGVFIADTMNSSYEFSGLVADTAYTIVVKSVDASGNVSAGATLKARTQAAPVVTPPINPTDPDDDVVEIPTNPTPAPTPSGSGGNTIIVTPAPEKASSVDEVKTALGKAKESLTIIDFVAAKSAIDSLTDEEKRDEFQKDLETLKKELKIEGLPTKKELRTFVPVGISLQVAMKSENYRYIDEASIQSGKNIFVLNSSGELVENVKVHVLFNRIFVTPLNGKFDSKETFTIILDTTVKGKASKDSNESFELKNPLMLEFTIR